MRIIGEFNNISDELKAKIVPLKPGEFAEYQLTSFQKIQDPTTGKTEIRYRHEQIYAKDTIWDPFYRSSGAPADAPAEGRSVNIGVPAGDGIDLREKTVTKVLMYEFARHRDGLMILSGNIPADREMDEFLQLTNRSKDSILETHRDASVEVVFRRVNKQKESKVKNDLRKAKATALTYVGNMGPAEMKEFAASKNWDYKQAPEVLSDMVGDYAEKYPLEFAAEASGTDMKRKAIIKFALTDGTINFDASGYRIMWGNGTVLAQLERKEGRNEIDAFSEWITTSTNGETILTQLKKKTPKEVPA